MKKTILAAVLFTMMSTTLIYGQTKEVKKEEAPDITFCGTTKGEANLTYADIVKCDEIMLKDKSLKIKSFNISFMVPAENPKDGAGLFIDRKNEGNKFSKENMEILKTLEAKKSKKLLIENVIALEADGKTERKLHGLAISLK